LYLYGQYENGEQVGGRIQYVKLFSLIALFILIIACINFMNLSTAQASKKMKEIGVKKTIGASRKTLVFQFIVESVSMAFLALFLAMLIVALLLPQFNVITGKALQLNFYLEFVLTLIAIALFTGLLSGFYPAFYLSGFNPTAVLKGKLPTSIGELWVRKGLVVFQFSLSVIFIVVFVVIKKQMDLIQTKNLGYNRNNVITFKREGKITGDAETFLSTLKTIPGVVNVGCIAGSVFDGWDSQSGFSWSGKETDKDYMFQSPRISYDAIETLGLKVVKGRSFSREFKDDDKKFILNESAAKMMGLDDPIGKIVKTFDGDCEIVGVVNDFQYGSMRQAIQPLVFRFRDARSAPNVMVKIKAGSEKVALQQMENYYKKFHTGYLFEYSFLNSDYKALYVAEERISILSRYFAGLAILISCLGLFGLAAFTAQKRQKEIGVRKIVGATVGNIVLMLSKDFLKLVAISIVIAVPFSWWVMDTWLQNFAYRTDISLIVFLVAACAILLVTLATVSFHAVKAAIANPVKSLRTE
jgi:ABC-type antimicrobial peptide transport system permease subunit